MASKGCNVILDTVFENGFQHWVYECVDLFKGHDITFVKVNCDIEELIRRENERKDRQKGLAAYQYHHMDFNLIYDIEVDTLKNTSDECAGEILGYEKDLNSLSAFERIHDCQ